MAAPSGIRRTVTVWLLLALPALAVTAVSSTDGSERRISPIVRAVADARAAVVNIQGQKSVPVTPADHLAEATKRVNGMGTGIVIDERGYILTNYHVVQGVGRIQVQLADGRQYVAKLVANDAETDLAVVKISTRRPLPLLRIGTSSDLMEGEEVIAMGNAYGYHHTVTRGIISALHRDVQISDTQRYEDLIQTDASINPGNSGGPLLNADGELIGINVAVRVGAQGIGFAIPVDKAVAVAARLMSTERLAGAMHGVIAQPLRPGAHRVVAQSVVPGSPAAMAGIKPGDEIVQVNRVTVLRPLDVERAMVGMHPGEEVQFLVRERDETKQVNLRLAQSRQRQVGNDRSRTAHTGGGSATSPLQLAWSQFGLRLTPLRDRSVVSGQFKGGLRVADVRPGSPAADQGVRRGDILVGMQRWHTTSADDLAYVLADAQQTNLDRLKFYIVRGRSTLYGHLSLRR